MLHKSKRHKKSSEGIGQQQNASTAPSAEKQEHPQAANSHTSQHAPEVAVFGILSYDALPFGAD